MSVKWGCVHNDHATLIFVGPAGGEICLSMA